MIVTCYDATSLAQFFHRHRMLLRHPPPPTVPRPPLLQVEAAIAGGGCRWLSHQPRATSRGPPHGSWAAIASAAARMSDGGPSD